MRMKFSRVPYGTKRYILETGSQSIKDLTHHYEKVSFPYPVREGVYCVNVGKDKNINVYVLHDGNQFRILMDTRVYSNDHIWQKYFTEVLAYEFTRYDFLRKIKNPDLFRVLNPRVIALYNAFDTWKRRKRLFTEARLTRKKIIGK